MERFHRYYSLHRILSSRRLPVPRAAIERELECSRATVNRVIDDLRGYGAPIEYLREQNGYRYTPGVAFELPGIWFNASELYALLAAQKLLAEAEPGLLDDTLQPLKRKIAGILSAEHLGGGEIARRVRILRMAGRGAGTFASTPPRPRWCSASVSKSSITDALAAMSPIAKSRRSTSFITATTGTSTRGAICARACAASRWNAFGRRR